MIIRLDRLGDEPFLWRETVEIDPATLDRQELIALSPISCSGRLRAVLPNYLLQAQLSYRQTLACIRCLREITVPVEADDMELLLTVVGGGKEEAENEDERELDSEDLSVVRLPDPAFDPLPLVREQVQLNIPMKPLCRPDCAGLCNRCGADLNDGSCDCAAPVDPRWSALAGIKDRLNG